MISLLFPLLLSGTSAAVLSERQNLAGSHVCDQIAGKVSGQVYKPLDLTLHYSQNIEHFMSSSTERPMCVVEVTSTEDVSNVMKIIGDTRTPFAVKSGGHASNPGFSSTTGVHISLAKLTQATLSEDNSMIEVGLGNHWTDLYKILDGSGVNVVGGRVIGPGTGGFTLGGGYSWLTCQHGLTSDTVISFNLVLPNGTATVVDSTKPDLFFALKGGLNRFGVVTSIIYRTVPQPNMVYGGIQVFDTSKIPALIEATQTFQDTNKDPKAQVILTINGGLAPGAILLSFYDGPSRPAAFDPYNNITPLLGSLETQSFASFSQVSPSGIASGNRGAFASLSTSGYTLNFLKAVVNESSFYGELALLHSGILLSYDVEPFLNYGQYATESAYPHSNSPLPLNLYFSWSLALEDTYWRGIMQQSINYLTEVAKAEGIYDPEMYVYPNYALDTYTGAQLYGPTNSARLRAIQSQYDPTGIMLLAGGFSI